MTALRPVTIALIGNPNSGKTTIFSSLTGIHARVANHPGATIEVKRGNLKLPSHGTLTNATLIDTPGVYTLSALTPDEQVTVEIITSADHPDLILNVIDSSNLARGLILTSQLLEYHIPTAIILTMTDISAELGIRIRKELLRRLLGIPVLTLKADGHCRPAVLAAIWELSTAKAGPGQASRPACGATLEERSKWAKLISEKVIAKHAPKSSPVRAKIDRILLNHIAGPAIFIVIMLLLFQSIFVIAAYPMNCIENVISYTGEALAAVLPKSIYSSLIIDGVIAGVGSVLVFLPQIATLFFIISLLENSGYLSRAAVLADTLLRPFGLQGRSFVPLLSGHACAVPAIMSARTVPSYRERLATIMAIPLTSCSARLPVYTVLVGALVPPALVAGIVSVQAITILVLYLTGLLGALLVASITYRSLKAQATNSFFVMEIPPLRLPSVKTALAEAWHRSKAFLTEAGTLILACTVLFWGLASFPSEASNPRNTLAGMLGSSLEPFFRPLGYSWELCVAILASFVAREVFVSALATVYQLDDISTDVTPLTVHIKERLSAGLLDEPTCWSLLVFYVFACMCFSTLAVTRRETTSLKWPLIMFCGMLTLAYGAAWITREVARYVTG